MSFFNTKNQINLNHHDGVSLKKVVAEPETTPQVLTERGMPVPMIPVPEPVPAPAPAPVPAPVFAVNMFNHNIQVERERRERERLARVRRQANEHRRPRLRVGGFL